MKTRRSEVLLVCGTFALLLPACRKAETTSASAPATPVAETVAPTPVPAATAATTTSHVTADPVAASQRNAERRRQHSSRPGEERSTGYDQTRASAPSTREHDVPAGTILRVAFEKTISTATAQPGETYRGELLDELLSADGTVVAPSGSRVVGKVENAVGSGRLGGQAELKLRLIELHPTGGRSVPISTSSYERKGESHTKHDAEYIAGGAAVGALLGQLIGRDTQSTLEGAAAGAAAGTGVGAATGKLDFEIQAGRTVAFTLEQALRLPEAR